MTTQNFETVDCCNCGIKFQVPEEWDENRREDGRWFYCPNGHKQKYTDCTDDKIEKLENENRELRAQVRSLKCRLMGKAGLKDRLKTWWLGGLAK